MIPVSLQDGAGHWLYAWWLVGSLSMRFWHSVATCYTLGQDMEAIGALFDGTACPLGNNGWLMVTVLVTAVIMAFGIAGGIVPTR